jgi:hypothetical protein
MSARRAPVIGLSLAATMPPGGYRIPGVRTPLHSVHPSLAKPQPQGDTE